MAYVLRSPYGIDWRRLRDEPETINFMSRRDSMAKKNIDLGKNENLVFNYENQSYSFEGDGITFTISGRGLQPPGTKIADRSYPTAKSKLLTNDAIITLKFSKPVGNVEMWCGHKEFHYVSWWNGSVEVGGPTYLNQSVVAGVAAPSDKEVSKVVFNPGQASFLVDRELYLVALAFTHD
jgi:hypothetical protein